MIRQPRVIYRLETHTKKKTKYQMETNKIK